MLVSELAFEKKEVVPNVYGAYSFVTLELR